MSAPVRILIVDDHSLFRDTLGHMLSHEPGLVVVAQCAGAAEAVRKLSEDAVDLVLLDFDLGAERGSALITWAAEQGFRGKFLVVTAGLADADAVWLIRHQVAGIFLKENPFRDLVTAIHTVARGGKSLDQPFLKLVVDAVTEGIPLSATPLFSEREQATLRLLIEGCSNKEIGERLQVSESAVKGTVQRLFDKAGVRSRGHLIRVAIQKYQNCL